MAQSKPKVSEVVLPRKWATAQGIRAVLAERIRFSTALDGQCRQCPPPTPVPIAPLDSTGCNWTVLALPRVSEACAPAVYEIIDAVKLEYNLAP